jgi:hypothetical protein
LNAFSNAILSRFENATQFLGFGLVVVVVVVVIVAEVLVVVME